MDLIRISEESLFTLPLGEMCWYAVCLVALCPDTLGEAGWYVCPLRCTELAVRPLIQGDRTIPMGWKTHASYLRLGTSSPIIDCEKLIHGHQIVEENIYTI